MEKVYEIFTVRTEPYPDQNFEMFGLRRKVVEFQKPNYVENIIQSILLSMHKECRHLVLGGDGRYYSNEVIDKVIKVCAANMVTKLTVGQNGFMSTPAISDLVRTLKCNGAFALSAGHNDGGPDKDFGIKYIISNGGLALDSVTKIINEYNKKIRKYRICKNLEYNITEIGTTSFKINTDVFILDVIDPVTRYVQMMKEIFDFNYLKQYVESGFKPIFNCVNGIIGLYVNRIFVEEFGIPPERILNSEPKENFGGHQITSSFSLTSDLIPIMKKDDTFDFGVTFNVDGERCMVLGQLGVYVTPSDSLAIIAAHSHYIPYFKLTGVKGYGRSIPTAAAIDRVANQTGKQCYVVPSGYSYFVNLMDANKVSICGEESFGIGSDHVRVKDAIWTVLSWITIMACKQKSLQAILISHWDRFGRDYYIRHDYQRCDTESCLKMMEKLQKTIFDSSFTGKKFEKNNHIYIVEKAENVTYTDPVDRSVVENEGIQIIFQCGSRIIFRKSKTEKQGCTIRVYANTYEKRTGMHTVDSETALQPLIDIALEISEIQKYTGRSAPSYSI